MGVVVLGSLNLDVVCRVETLPAPGETVAGLGVSQFPGGKGLNQAIAAARWDSPTAMIGAVGDDAAGQTLVGALSEAGADASAVLVNTAAQTGQAFIFVSAAGENVIVVAGGANLVLTAPPRFDLQGFTVALAQLETPIPATRALFEAVGAAGGLTLLNAAPAIEAGAALFPLADILIVNETELARYAKVAAAPERIEDIAVLARSLLCRPAQRVVVTLGAAGAAAVAAGRVIQVPGHTAKVVDTTGAGDCFCGVLAAVLSEGGDLAEAMAQANAAAALSTEVHGAAVSMPGRAQTLARLREG